jgi:hypothetical protein
VLLVSVFTVLQNDHDDGERSVQRYETVKRLEVEEVMVSPVLPQEKTAAA